MAGVNRIPNCSIPRTRGAGIYPKDEQARELESGLHMIATQVLGKLERLLDNDPNTTIPKSHLQDNPYWPPEVASETSPLAHERPVILLSLALSQTQDDKGRVRWTLFGNSEQGPARAPAAQKSTRPCVR